MRLPIAPLIALILGVACFFCLGCPPRKVGSSPEVDPPTQLRAKQRWPDATGDELRLGRTVLVRECGECHARPGPEYTSAADWPTVMRTMAKKSKLTDAEAQAVLRYLIAAQP